MNFKVAPKGPLKTYMIWPIVMAAMWTALVIALFFVNTPAAIMALVVLIIHIVITALIWTRIRAKLLDDLITFAAGYGQVQRNLLKDFVLPYALLTEDGRVLWMNEAFKELTGKDKTFHKSITAIFSSLTKDKLPGVNEQTECELRINDRDFRAAMEIVHVDDFIDEQTLVETAAEARLIAFYLFDETELNQLLEEREQNRQVCGVLSLDNYDEALESVEEVRQSLLLALVDRKINKYFTEAEGVVRKLDKDRYFFVIRKGALEEMKESRFSLLDDVKTVNIGNTMAVTLSMGIGMGGGSYAADAESARVAIELALGRGGDQVVIRDGENTTYYGGKTMSVEKGNRVKARVKAHALREIMSTKETILVMGHQLTDIDALGAGIGIYCAGRAVDKEVHLVINDPQEDIRNIMKEFIDKPEYPEDLFLNSKQALEIAGKDSAVIMVDTNRPTYTECEELLNRTNTVVVIDHHRQGKEVVRNAVLNYVEPYASSACEMVAEILQYFGDDVKLRPLEADMLYGGIMIDTNSFQTRAGVRTFEAAAYLRRSGADITRVRKRFRESIEDYRTKAKIIAAAEIFDDVYAISVCPTQGIASPTVISSQAANELLNVGGVKASFVLTQYHDMIYISARAIDEINVQLIMERLGGGGHMNIAGTQLKDMTLDEAKELLKTTIEEMAKEGEI